MAIINLFLRLPKEVNKLSGIRVSYLILLLFINY